MNLYHQLRALNDVSRDRNEIVRAPFGYPGSKARSIKSLLEFLPYRKAWIDAFAGSGTVTLARHSCDLEVFNDRCAGVTAFFRACKDREKLKELIGVLDMTICSREEFLWCRESWEKDLLDDVQRAARWYYCVSHSFSQKGWAFGRSTSGRGQCQKLHNNLELFWPINHRFRNVYVENQDYRNLIKDFNNDRIGNDIVWYFDPSYWKTNRVYNHEFKEEEHYELAERCMHLNGFIALSGYDSPEHPYNNSRFKWDRKESWEVHVSMTGLAFTEENHLSAYEGAIERGMAKETLWIKDNN